MWPNSVDLGNEKKKGVHCILLFQLLCRPEIVQKKKKKTRVSTPTFYPLSLYFLQSTSDSLKLCTYLFH